nr:HAMP domain-containing sensor histidine kinase [Salinibacter ruber]
MLANMSHEIRTPLTSIIGFADAIGEETQDAERAALRFANLIGKSGRRLLNTLDGVLNLSKLEAGQMQLKSTAVDIAAQAETIAEELRPKAEGKGLRLRVDAGEAPVWAEADEGGVQIVLQNLVSNAIKSPMRSSTPTPGRCGFGSPARGRPPSSTSKTPALAWIQGWLRPSSIRSVRSRRAWHGSTRAPGSA